MTSCEVKKGDGDEMLRHVTLRLIVTQSDELCKFERKNCDAK